MIYTIGKDTTAIGNYEWKGYDFSMTVADLTDGVIVNRLDGTFFPNGELQAATGNMYKPVPGKDSQSLISKAIYFNGQQLPEGEYSIFTLPSKNGWTIMFNKDSNIWGTEYKAENDILRVPMTTTPLPDSTELLTIAIVPTETGKRGKIEVSWERLKASVPFTTSAQ